MSCSLLFLVLGIAWAVDPPLTNSFGVAVPPLLSRAAGVAMVVGALYGLRCQLRSRSGAAAGEKDATRVAAESGHPDDEEL